ncbi:TPA: hypothetical protein ACH3X2_002047 [Trebouxia sp. C0005]
MADTITAQLVYRPEHMPVNTAKKLLAKTFRCGCLLGLQDPTSKQTEEALKGESDVDLGTPAETI